MVLSRVGPFVKTAIEFGRRTGGLASGESFIRKYAPPRQRKSLVKVVRAFEQAATGAGLYQIYQELNSDGTNNIDYAVPRKLSRFDYKQRKARSGYGGRTHKRKFKKCDCQHCYRKKRKFRPY